MPKLEASIFVDLVLKSGLVDGKQLAQALSAADQPISDSGIVCSSLINAGLLTPWQSEQLLNGRYQGFFVGKYKMLDKLGRGGMSSVYLAEHLEMGRRVAIKVLTGRLAARPEHLERFRSEARAAARVDHPNIVRAYDVGHEGNVHFLVMEYIQGSDLQQIVTERGPLDCRVAADYIRQAAVGLAHVHRVGMIHRDIKPANLLVDQQGTIKIVDLGLARLSEETREELEDEKGQQVLGTVDYLAPEQSIDSHNVTASADIYSLGCSMYFLLTGKPPFPEGTAVERVRMHRSKDPQNIFALRPDAVPALVAICQKMMAKSPADRYPTANHVEEILQAWLAGKSSRMLGMMAVRPPRAPTAPARTDDEELTLAPISDDRTAASSQIKQSMPTMEVSPPPTKDPARATVPTQGQPGLEPLELESPELEPLSDEPPVLDGLLEELQNQHAEDLGMPASGTLNLAQPAARKRETRESFSLWLLGVAGIVLAGVIGMIVWLVINSLNP